MLCWRVEADQPLIDAGDGLLPEPGQPGGVDVCGGVAELPAAGGDVYA